jgi:hypothetical protein
MATTTNYGWTTPDDTALVKDGAAAIRTLGSSVDTTTKNLNPSTTLGDIEYRSSSANTNTRLGIGSTGDVLTVTGGVPVWAAPAGGGKLLQVVNALVTSAANISSSSFTDTNLTATITPTSATSKILVLISQKYAWSIGGNNSYQGMGIQLHRDATNIYSLGTSSADYIQLSVSTNVDRAAIFAMQYYDSPATTSAVTYKTMGAVDRTVGSGTVSYNGSPGSSITLLEIGA